MTRNLKIVLVVLIVLAASIGVAYALSGGSPQKEPTTIIATHVQHVSGDPDYWLNPPISVNKNIVMASTKPQPDHQTFSKGKVNSSDWPWNTFVVSSDDGKYQVGLFSDINSTWNYIWEGKSVNSSQGQIISDGVKIRIKTHFTYDGGWFHWVFTDDNGIQYTFGTHNDGDDVNQDFYCSMWPNEKLIISDQIPMVRVL